jgi:hypothetical protein
MSEKSGWRGLADDLLRIQGVTLAVIGSLATVGTVLWVWWAKAWNMPSPILALMGLAAFVLLFVAWYFIALVSNKYFGVPAVHPFYPVPFHRSLLPSPLPPPPLPVKPPPVPRALPPVSKASAAEIVGRADRIYVNKTPEELVEQVRGLTSIKADDVVARYAGKWMRVAGPVRNVTGLHGWVSVPMDWGKSNMTVMLRFQPAWLSRVEHLDPQELLAVEGQIEDIEINISIGALTLENCAVIELASVPAACVWPSPGSTP